MACARVLFPRGMDANEYALKVAPAAKGLQVLLNRAEWLGGAAVAAKEEAASGSSLAAVVVGDEVVVSIEDRRYRVRGLEKNTSFEVLKVNVPASRGEGFHVDTLDLYAARPRAAFIKLAAVEMGLKEEFVKRGGTDGGAFLVSRSAVDGSDIRRLCRLRSGGRRRIN